MISKTISFHGVTYRPTGSSHRRHSCTIQRAQDVADGDIYYLIIRNGELMGRAHTGEGAMVMASAYNPNATQEAV